MDAGVPVKIERLQRLSRAFTPSAPVTEQYAFSGRVDQLFQLITALAQAGRQVVLYGERGVGKTSLANVLSQFRVGLGDGQALRTVRINCNTQDNFGKVWRRVFREAGFEWPEEWNFASPEPDDIRMQLAKLEAVIIILDEFDRLEDDDALSLMADTLKSISDHVLKTKVVVVGVATSIDQLIGEHESIQRAIEEVLLPRMSRAEMLDILANGAKEVGIAFASSAERRIIRIAEGLPHFVHLLALSAGRLCISDDRDMVNEADVEKAAQNAVTSHSLLKDWQTAIQSSREGTLFAHVLTACALVEKNPLGQFTSGSLRDPLQRLTGRPYDIPAFAPHLNAFTAADRGSVLIKEGVGRRYTYRFRNPLLQPFAILVGMREGLIPDDYLAELMGDNGGSS